MRQTTHESASLDVTNGCLRIDLSHCTQSILHAPASLPCGCSCWCSSVRCPCALHLALALSTRCFAAFQTPSSDLPSNAPAMRSTRQLERKGSGPDCHAWLLLLCILHVRVRTRHSSQCPPCIPFSPHRLSFFQPPCSIGNTFEPRSCCPVSIPDT